MIDIIGDIHGHSKELINLLEKLGYKKQGNTYTHQERTVLFLGDYIDRGKEQKEVISIVRNMVDSGFATALIGNHEYNAILFGTFINGEFMRKHTEHNIHQHKAFLDSFKYDSKNYYDTLSWFKTLPLFLDTPNFNAVHAAWIEDDINFLKQCNDIYCNNNYNNILLNNDFLHLISKKEREYHAIENILKGPEISLPKDIKYKDTYGIERNKTRLNWFCNISKNTYQDRALSLPDGVILPDLELKNNLSLYTLKKPVFLGHYWMNGFPKIQNEYAACLDFSVAKEGKLVAYRFNGEKELTNKNIFF